MSNEITILLENESSMGQFVSNKLPGSGYHQKYDNLHTFVLIFSEWDGDLTLQGTLEMFPAESDWFDLRDSADTKLMYSGENDGTVTANSRGNFLWIRAVGSTNSGSIDQIRYIH